MHLSLYNKLLCNILSNALEISRKTPLTSKLGLESKALQMSRTIKMSWCTQESSGPNSDW